jgi:hypothetical protein
MKDQVGLQLDSQVEASDQQHGQMVPQLGSSQKIRSQNLVSIHIHFPQLQCLQ